MDQHYPQTDIKKVWGICEERVLSSSERLKGQGKGTWGKGRGKEQGKLEVKLWETNKLKLYIESMAIEDFSKDCLGSRRGIRPRPVWPLSLDCN